jgi:hypothetical protein
MSPNDLNSVNYQVTNIDDIVCTINDSWYFAIPVCASAGGLPNVESRGFDDSDGRILHPMLQRGEYC